MKKFLKVGFFFLLFAVVITAFLIAGYFLFKYFQSRNQLPGTSIETSKSNEELAKERKTQQAVLLDTVEELFKIESPSTSYAISVIDLKNNEEFGVDEKTPLHAASVSKILTASYILDQIEQGKTSLEEPLGAYNLEFQLQTTVNRSDPETWEILDERFKPTDQNKFAKEIGLKQTNLTIGKNLMSTRDVALLLKKIYRNEIFSSLYTDKLLGYMKNTESENFFSPTFKQNSLIFYHKTGKFDSSAHDAAIVEHSKYPFVIVLFTINKTNLEPNSRAGIMQNVASLVLDYFNNLERTVD